MKIQPWQLKQRQSLSLDKKVAFSRRKICEWYWHWGGKVYISFSGGKDSTVLLDLVRSEFPEVPAVFVDTGLEYPEIREFVKIIDNVIWLKPKMTFPKVIEKYGYPVVSKVVSMAVSRYRNTKSPLQKRLRLHGGMNPNTGKVQTVGVIPKKWRFLLDAPFDISERCCDVMKKAPFKRYNKESGRHSYIGTMASDGRMRAGDYYDRGCNVFDATMPQSRPLSIWLEDDIWEYIRVNDMPYSKIYDTGEDRTGCMFCMFGLHMESGVSRFERMKRTHPKQHDYCMEDLGLGKVLEYVKRGGDSDGEARKHSHEESQARA